MRTGQFVRWQHQFILADRIASVSEKLHRQLMYTIQKDTGAQWHASSRPTLRKKSANLSINLLHSYWEIACVMHFWATLYRPTYCVTVWEKEKQIRLRLTMIDMATSHVTSARSLPVASMYAMPNACIHSFVYPFIHSLHFDLEQNAYETTNSMSFVQCLR